MAKMVSDKEREELEETELTPPLDRSVYGTISTELPTDPIRIQQAAAADVQSQREKAAFAQQARERAERKAKAAAQHERENKIIAGQRELDAQEREAELEAQKRAEYAPMPDAAWKALWPKVRERHYIEQHDATQRAEANNGEVYREMTGTRY
jgi:hypothetical protein